MDRKLVSYLGWTFAVLFVLLTAEVATVSVLRYFTSLVPAPEPVLGNAFAHPYLWIHVATGTLALIIAPLQLLPATRERMPLFHRTTGRIYIVACAISAPASFLLALGTFAGPIAATGFAVAAVLWPLFTAMGVRAAIRGRFDEHRAWMLRSYAILGNAITLRLMLPLAGVLGFSFVPAYQVISWLGWVTNLALVELYLRRRVSEVQPVEGLATA